MTRNGSEILPKKGLKNKKTGPSTGPSSYDHWKRCPLDGGMIWRLGIIYDTTDYSIILQKYREAWALVDYTYKLYPFLKEPNMNKFAKEPDEELGVEKRKPFVPRVITGGKGGDGGSTTIGDSGDNWLSDLDTHTTFLIQKKKDFSEDNLQQVVLGFKGKKSVLLIFELPDGKRVPIWKDPNRFCNEYRLFEVLQTKEEYFQEIEINSDLAKQNIEERTND